MRVICPHCQKSVTLPDSVADQATPCPACSQMFTAPVLLTAPETPPIEPPKAEPAKPETYGVAPAPERPTIAPPTASPVPAGEVKSMAPRPAAESAPGAVRFTLSKTAMIWLGPVGLVVFFVLTWFNWVGAYPGGRALYTQTAWQAMRGAFSTAEAMGEQVFQRESDLRAQSGWSLALTAALLLAIPTVLIALLDLCKDYANFSVPDAVQRIWPHRRGALTVATLVIFLLITVQLYAGLGIERAASAAAAARFQPADPTATVTSDKVAEREFRTAEEVARYGIAYTGWFWLAYLALLLSLTGFGLEAWLERRGSRPEPSVEFHW